jgi:hypothetical protein
MMGLKAHLARLGLVIVCATLAGCPLFFPIGGAPSTGAPRVSVSPTVLDFGSNAQTQNFTIRNAGTGTLEWELLLPDPWISANIESGSVTGGTDRVILTVDRDFFLTPGRRNGSVIVRSNGGEDVEVRVGMRVDGTPTSSVSPTTITFPFGSSTQPRSEEITIENDGDDTLTWSVSLRDPANTGSTIPRPAFLSFSPTTGSTAPGATSTVTVTFSPEAGAPEAPIIYPLRIETNAGTATVSISFIQAASRGVIGSEPQVLDFGRTDNVRQLTVYNDGPAGTLLEFTLRSNRPDLISFNPSSGESRGSQTSIPGVISERDPVNITVTIDRSALQSALEGATIFIEADGLDPVEVPVTVERAPLTLEGAINRTRPPFILRFIFTIRNEFGRTVDTTDPNVLEQLQTAFSIEENSIPLDLDETSVFVSPATGLRSNVAFVFDFSGSMYNAGAGNGAVINTVRSAAREFINDLPEAYRLALLEFHDRQQANRLINGFTTNRASSINALDNFSLLIGEHGASELYDALIEACERLANQDLNVLPFDDADLRAVVFVSDGRDTSSFATLDDVISTAEDLRVRLYPIGFGNNVNAAPLIQMASATGGHYYPAPNSAALRSILENEAGAGPGAPGELIRDLERQVVLTYITLFQEGGNTYLITADLDGNRGSFQRDAVVAINGDVRAGQITLASGGINAGQATVFIRTEYTPRAVTQLRFRILTNQTFSVELDPDGPISDWVLINEGGGVFLAITNEANPLQYGMFGNLLRVNFTGLTGAPFNMGFRVDNRVYLDPPTARFFQYPFGITVGPEPSVASEFPLLLEDEFDPDSPFAFDRDEDGVPDFEDLDPENPNFS